MASRPHNRRRPSPEILCTAALRLLCVIAQLTHGWMFHHFSYPGIYEPRPSAYQLPAARTSISTTAMFGNSSGGTPCRSCRYAGLL